MRGSKAVVPSRKRRLDSDGEENACRAVQGKWEAS